MSLAAFERSGMVVRLISVVFGFDLGTAAVVTFFDLGSCRWGLIILGASEEPIVVASDGRCVRRLDQAALASRFSHR